MRTIIYVTQINHEDVDYEDMQKCVK